MIDNIILLLTGTLHQRSISELLPKCHPLGSFEQMEAINIASTPAELYNAVLVDTPLGQYTYRYFIVMTELRPTPSLHSFNGSLKLFYFLIIVSNSHKSYLSQWTLQFLQLGQF
jgi:vacuolar-type H+-ATPase subunit C/Vma6